MYIALTTGWQSVYHTCVALTAHATELNLFSEMTVSKNARQLHDRTRHVLSFVTYDLKQTKNESLATENHLIKGK